jgi:thioredoxin reductase
MARSDSARVAILGAGPIGLEAALYAATLNLPVTVYERGTVGAHLRQWGHVRMFSPFGMNRTPLGLAAIRADSGEEDLPGDRDCLTGREHVTVYLEPLARSARLRERLRLGVEVLHIGRRGCLKTDPPGDPRRGQQPFLLLVRDAKGQERIEEADVVLDCTGTYGRHRWLGNGGIPALGEKANSPQIAYGLEDVLGERRAHYAGRNVLVVGGGYSAATTACSLAALGEKEPATWAIWVARISGTQPLKRIVSDPLTERDRLAMRANTLATRPEGNVEFHSQTVIEAIEPVQGGLRVQGRIGSQRKAWEVERIIANVGYAPDMDVARELHVHDCDAAPVSSPQGSGILRMPEPNYYVLGAKSYGRNSQFLLRNGFEQVREVFALIAGKPDLNLFKKP